MHSYPLELKFKSQHMDFVFYSFLKKLLIYQCIVKICLKFIVFFYNLQFGFIYVRFVVILAQNLFVN